MDAAVLKKIGDKHEGLVPDKTRFRPMRSYVEEIEAKRGEGGLPEDIEQRIERIVAARLEDAFSDILARLGTLEEDVDAMKAEIQRRKGGRPPKQEQDNG